MCAHASVHVCVCVCVFTLRVDVKPLIGASTRATDTNAKTDAIIVEWCFLVSACVALRWLSIIWF